MFAEMIISLASHLFCLILGIGDRQNFPPPLSAEEERRLFAEKEKGSADARNRLIEHNLRLVSHMVRKYYLTYPNQDDLVSIGSLGLVKAVDSFNAANGAKFATYAAKCIQNEILMFFRSQKKLAGEVSLSETIDTDKDGNALTFGDILSTEDTSAEDLDRKMAIERVLRVVNTALDEREKEIIVLRYGLGKKPPMTQKDVAKGLGISRSYVSRIEKKALEKMKERFKDNIPDLDYF
ncbi:MAG: RNA polymerase sporulation sigma factor SigK [Clostridia bacterium]|nr:RNA polymerase sporulation sigma factor SigK [Clostridia bacterium]